MTISMVMIRFKIRFSNHGSIHPYTSRSQGFQTVAQMKMVTMPSKAALIRSDAEASTVFVTIARAIESTAAMAIATIRPARLLQREIRITASFSASFAAL